MFRGMKPDLDDEVGRGRDELDGPKAIGERRNRHMVVEQGLELVRPNVHGRRIPYPG